MNPWTRVGVDEPRSRVEGGEPVLCDYGHDVPSSEGPSAMSMIFVIHF
jgi:hypothetical protein